MKRAVLVISDVHLAPTFDSDRLPFRSACFSPAAYLSQTIDRAVEHARAARGGLEIVLAGDVFDFDVPQSAEEAAIGLRLADTTTPAVATHVLQRTLLDHLPFLLALQRATRAGARVVVLPGNHDAQLGFVSVQKLLGSAIGQSVTFAPWYYAAAGGVVHVEHGHLYDPLCAVARLCLGNAENETNTERTIGTISSFYAPLLFPAIDPFVSDPFTERSAFRTMVSQGLSRLSSLSNARPLLACVKELLIASGASEKSRSPFDDASRLALELGIEPAQVDYLRGFFAPKATASEALAMCTGNVDYAGSVEERTLRAMTAALDVHGANVAVVGHTHRAGTTLLPETSASLSLRSGRSGHLRPRSLLLNSGAWTPRRSPAEPVGSYAWITTDNGRIDDASVKQVYRS